MVRERVYAQRRDVCERRLVGSHRVRVETGYSPPPRHWGAWPGGTCGEGVLRECTLRNFLRRRQSHGSVCNRRSSVALRRRRRRWRASSYHSAAFLSLSPPTCETNVSDNNNNAISQQNSRDFALVLCAPCRRRLTKIIVKISKVSSVTFFLNFRR